MSDEFYRKLTTISTEWAEADRDACEAEADLKRVGAKLFLVFRAGGSGVEESKQRVEAADEYNEIRTIAIECRYRAHLAKRAVTDAETSFHRWQSLQANERFVARVAT